MPYLTLVSKHSTYVYRNYNHSRIHFIENFFNQSSFHLMKKMTQLLFNLKNIWQTFSIVVREVTVVGRYFLYAPRKVGCFLKTTQTLTLTLTDPHDA